ncbi:MAG: OmpA family protein [Gammaproteobacteria bacterium]|nr:OmpA family protein [Gammaproteobacteria bacterium]
MLFSSDPKYSESLLYAYFHEFHDELMRIKQLITSGEWTAGGVPEDEAPIPMPFRQDLIVLLERQSIDAAQRGGEHGAKVYRECQYLMAALADEFFLHLLDWDGKELWRTQLLELKMFNSQAAGQRVFENLETLLRKRDPITLELARIYLIVLALGFQGKYRDMDDAGSLGNFRRQLYFLITQRDPNTLSEHLHYDANMRLFPDTYAYTNRTGKEGRQWLPSMFKWYAAIVFTGIGFLISSFVLWHLLSSGVKLRAEEVVSKQIGWELPRHQPQPVPVPVRLEADTQTVEAPKIVDDTSVREIASLREELEQAEARAVKMEKDLDEARQVKQKHSFVFGDLSYAVGKAELAPGAEAGIDQLVEALRANPNSQVLMMGYTDSTGGAALNLKLSKQRADVLRSALIKKGIEPSRITTKGYGESMPVASNKTAEGRQKNRRVEVVFFSVNRTDEQ